MEILVNQVKFLGKLMIVDLKHTNILIQVILHGGLRKPQRLLNETIGSVERERETLEPPLAPVPAF